MNSYQNFDFADAFMILTPNRNEFERFYNKVFDIKEDNNKKESNNDLDIFDNDDGGIYSIDVNDDFNLFKKEIQLANKLNNKIIIRKVNFV
jgi:hypothetical protein